MDDWQLLSRASESRGALGTLFQRHKDYVFRVAWGCLGSREAADDTVQEVFLRLGDRRLRFEPRARFRTWLYKVALNTAREIRRKRSREVSMTDQQMPIEEPTTEAAGEAELAALKRALDKLPARQREVVVLRFLEQLSTAETARVLGCREGTVKAHLHRAVHALRRFFTNQSPSTHGSIE